MKNSSSRMLCLAAGMAALLGNAYASYTVPIRNGGYIQFAWVGDLNGDGNQDFLIDRQENPQRIEAYTHTGAFMWEVNFGPNSANQDNISPGSATVDVGHNDGVTVYDLNGDGRSEVIIKIANGVRFGNGETWSASNNNHQWIAVLNGATGARLATSQIPTDYLSIGPIATRLVCGNAGVFMYGKNRNSNGSFNLMVCRFSWNGSSTLTQNWKWLRGSQNCPDGHNSRVVDLNEDGTDDFSEIGFALNGATGSLLYTLGTQGVVHGDRFHIAKIDPDRAGLQGYGIQQDNPSGLIDYYYDARNGSMIWKHSGAVSDWARGDAGDIDPAVRGYEVWTFNGVWNAKSNSRLCPNGNEPWPSLRLWWDTDDQAESYNDGKIEQYLPTSTASGRRVQRLYTITDYASDAATNTRGAPIFYGDFIGDWREEVILRNTSNNKLYILTPPGTSSTRGSLRDDRYYRNCLSAKGYMQSHHVSFYIGAGGSQNGSDTYQGESATLAGGVTIDTNNSGYNGTGFLNFPASGGSATFTNVDGNGGGAKTLSIRYANGNAAARTGTISVNNGTATNITFAPTGAWNAWTTMTVTITLNNTTTNTIRFNSTGSDLGNIDEITVP